MTRRTRRWDEETIRVALSELLASWDEWPTARQFEQLGAKSLREAITRIRGPAWWAREMGLPGGDRRPGGIRRWTDDVIRETLEDFLGDRPTWPTSREFDAAGLYAFRAALRRYGGAARWAGELGVDWAPPPGQRAPSTAESASERTGDHAPPRTAEPAPQGFAEHAAGRQWPKWREATIDAELRSFVEGRTDWPRFAEFVASGRKGLYQAVLKHGGAQLWATRVGVSWARRHGGRQAKWSEERIRERLEAFLGERTTWPAPVEFMRAGERALLAAVRRHGGIARWATELGLDTRAASLDPKGGGRQRRWTDERIEVAIAPLVRQLGRWPTKTEFRRAGLGPALAAVYEGQGRRWWQQRFGVSPRGASVPVPDRRRWSTEGIEAELRAFCAGRTTWPRFTEFQAAGRNDLYRALTRYGGASYWRERVGLTFGDREPIDGDH